MDNGKWIIIHYPLSIVHYKEVFMKKYRMKINDQEYEAKVVEYSEAAAKITVNGIDFEIEFLSDEKTTTTPIVQVERAVSPPPPPPEIKKIPQNQNASDVKAPIPGVIVGIKVSVGDTVKNGDILLILEAMKMESEILATTDGVIDKIHVKDRDTVTEGDLLMTIMG